MEKRDSAREGSQNHEVPRREAANPRGRGCKTKKFHAAKRRFRMGLLFSKVATANVAAVAQSRYLLIKQ